MENMIIISLTSFVKEKFMYRLTMVNAKRCIGNDLYRNQNYCDFISEIYTVKHINS